MNVLVLGGYGLIGQHIVRRLISDGHKVTGLSRNANRARQSHRGVAWQAGDLNALVTPAAWAPFLNGVDAVVNASGALQTGLKDDLSRVQSDAIVALVEAAETAGVRCFVQVSAPGAAVDAETEFLRTKGEADAAVKSSRLCWVILKPGLVIAPSAYGGTALIRLLAAFPVVQPLALPDSRIQTVHVDDVSEGVALALSDPDLWNAEFDLVAASPMTLAEVVASVRSWLGFSKARALVRVPERAAFLIGRIADIAGSLGWRSPLRTTALMVLRDDVTGDPEPWRRASGRSCRSLEETLDALPATRQERIFARSLLVFPILAFSYALFWIVSGAIGLWQAAAAEQVIEPAVGSALARFAVLLGSLADIAVGLMLAVRPTFVWGCLAAIGLSAVYLGAGTFLTPELWADPLGPFVKVVPAIGLGLALLAMAEER